MTENTPPQYMDDEIDLFELWDNIWQQRFVVVTITALATVIGLAYALMATPIYKSEAYLLPPLSKDLQELQINISDVASSSSDGTRINVSLDINVDSKSTFERLTNNLRSRTLRRDFYEANELAIYFSENPTDQSSNRLFQNNFNNKISVTTPSNRDEGNQMVVSFEITDAELSAKWLNAYVDYAIAQTKTQIIEDVRSKIQKRVSELEMMMSSMRSTAENKRQDRLAELEEALQLAKSIGLRDIQSAESPVPEKEYLRGTRALEAEIAVLKQRKSDDPFIDGIRDLQRYLSYLNSITIEPENVQIARIDQQALVPQGPIKPNKKLIVILSVLLGGMLGVFVALIRAAVKNRRANIASSN